MSKAALVDGESILKSGRPIVWTDRSGVTHRADGDRMVPWDRGTFILWTLCGQKDIPANCGWMQREVDIVNCPQCAAMLSARKEGEPSNG